MNGNMNVYYVGDLNALHFKIIDSSNVFMIAKVLKVLLKLCTLILNI